MSIFQDIKTAVKITGDIRRIWEDGASAVQLRPVYRVPLITLKPAFLNTVEGCQAWNMGQDINQAVTKVFYSFPHDVQRQLEYTPDEPGGWVKRARFWQEQLKPVLPPKMYHAVIIRFIRWYAHCLRMRKGGVVV